MRIAATSVFALACLFAACASSDGASTESPYSKPNALLGGEIHQRVEQIPYQHREELLQNLLWLAQQGEPAIPALLTGLKHDHPKVRSSSAWVLGRIRDRRTVPDLKAVVNDSNETVRLEVARTLVVIGDLQYSPSLIEGLDSDKKEVRFLCHEALKTATGHDFGFDHLSEDLTQRRTAVLNWRQWWGDYAGDANYAPSYQRRFNVGMPAVPSGETQMQDPGKGQSGNGEQPMTQDPPPAPAPTPAPAPEPTPTPAPTPAPGGTGGDEKPPSTGTGTGTSGTSNGNGGISETELPIGTSGSQPGTSGGNR